MLNGQSNLLVLSLPVTSQVKDNVQAEHGYTVFTAMKALSTLSNLSLLGCRGYNVEVYTKH